VAPGEGAICNQRPYRGVFRGGNDRRIRRGKTTLYLNSAREKKFFISRVFNKSFLDQHRLRQVKRTRGANKNFGATKNTEHTSNPQRPGNYAPNKRTFTVPYYLE